MASGPVENHRMCGFAATVSTTGDKPDLASTERMAQSLAHRGPDSTGSFSRGHVSLAFQRLSILDLSSNSHQPFVSDDGRLALVFNGEIFNYQELRGTLMDRGHTFRSSGDTEVLLESYREWGIDCLNRLNGMWAFVLYDAECGKVFAARDRFGIKPLYFAQGANEYHFASEIKALHVVSPSTRDIDEVQLASLLASGRLENVPASTNTFFRNVRQLAPGSYCVIDADGGVTHHRYWTLPDSVDTTGDPVTEFRDLFMNSVELRLRSDVPVGVSLSGGMDSSAIISAVAALRRSRDISSVSTLHAFSYMPAEFDESSYIRSTIEQSGATLHEVRITPQRFWDGIPSLLEAHDEPVHSATAFISYEIYRAARAEGIKVVLCGQGADETLGGYPSFFRNWWYTILRGGQGRRLRNEIEDYCRGHGRHVVNESVATGLRLALTSADRSSLYRAAVAGRRYRSAYPYASLLHPDLQELLPTPAQLGSQHLDTALRFATERAPLPLYLRLEDRNSMAHSVEARLPFLDYRIVEFAFRLAGEWKIRGRWNKYVLREAMRDIIPETVRTRVDKMGFPTPMDAWIRGELRDQVGDLLLNGQGQSHRFVQRKAIEQLMSAHGSGSVNAGSAIFNLAQAELWLRTIGNRAIPSLSVPRQRVS